MRGWLRRNGVPRSRNALCGDSLRITLRNTESELHYNMPPRKINIQTIKMVNLLEVCGGAEVHGVILNVLKERGLLNKSLFLFCRSLADMIESHAIHQNGMQRHVSRHVVQTLYALPEDVKVLIQ